MRLISAPKGKRSRPKLEKPAEFHLSLDFTEHLALWRQLLEEAGKNMRTLEEQALFCIQTGLSAGAEEKPRASQAKARKARLPKHLQGATPAVIRSYLEGQP